MIHTRPSNANYLMVMLIDLDNFKALNDTHGHKAGDQALVHTARTLSATADPQVVIARIGGEEFCSPPPPQPAPPNHRHPTLYNSHRYHSQNESQPASELCAPPLDSTTPTDHDVLLENSSRPPTRQCIQQNATAATKSITPNHPEHGTALSSGNIRQELISLLNLWI